MTPGAVRTLPWDWHAGTIPANVDVHEEAYVETTFSFHLFRGETDGAVRYARGAHTYLGTMFDVGPGGRVRLGEHALVHGARIICDAEVDIGDHALISWNVVLMDTYRVPRDRAARASLLRELGARSDRVLPPLGDARPVRLEPNVWIGFEACVLPGVTVGRGAVVGARSVVCEDVPPYTVVAGNPARVVRTLEVPGG